MGLLYVTDLVGIAVAAATVFLLLGDSLFHQTRRGMVVSIALLSLLVIPLGISMRELILENELSREIKSELQNETKTFKHVRLKIVEVKRFKDPMDVIVTVYGMEDEFTSEQMKAVPEPSRALQVQSSVGPENPRAEERATSSTDLK